MSILVTGCAGFIGFHFCSLFLIKNEKSKKLIYGIDNLNNYYNVKLKLVWGIRCSNMKLIYYPWKLRLIIYLSKIFSFTANSIIYNSHAGLDYHLSLGFSKKLNKVVHNGIDEKKFFFL